MDLKIAIRGGVHFDLVKRVRARFMCYVCNAALSPDRPSPLHCHVLSADCNLCPQVMRDIQRSGQRAGEVIQQVSDTVYPMYKAFIERDLEKAEIKVLNNFNPFAGFKEPVQILKTSDPVTVEAAADVLRRLFPNSEVSQVCIQLHSQSIACMHDSLHTHTDSFWGPSCRSLYWHGAGSQFVCMSCLRAIHMVGVTCDAIVSEQLVEC